MKNTRTRTSAKPAAVTEHSPKRWQVLLVGGCTAWLGVFWPILVTRGLAVEEILLALACPLELLLGTLSLGARPAAVPQGPLGGIALRGHWRRVWLLVVFPVTLAAALAFRPEAQNQQLLGATWLTLLGLTLCLYGSFAVRFCAAPTAVLNAVHMPLGDGPWDAPVPSPGWLQPYVIGICFAGAGALVFVAPTWGAPAALEGAGQAATLASSVLAAIVGTALGVATLTVHLGTGLRRSDGTPGPPGATLRTTWYLAIALLGAITYIIIKP